MRRLLLLFLLLPLIAGCSSGNARDDDSPSRSDDETSKAETTSETKNYDAYARKLWDLPPLAERDSDPEARRRLEALVDAYASADTLFIDCLQKEYLVGERFRPPSVTRILFRFEREQGFHWTFFRPDWGKEIRTWESGTWTQYAPKTNRFVRQEGDLSVVPAPIEAQFALGSAWTDDLLNGVVTWGKPVPRDTKREEEKENGGETKTIRPLRIEFETRIHGVAFREDVRLFLETGSNRILEAISLLYMVDEPVMRDINYLRKESNRGADVKGAIARSGRPAESFEKARAFLFYPGRSRLQLKTMKVRRNKPLDDPADFTLPDDAVRAN